MIYILENNGLPSNLFTRAPLPIVITPCDDFFTDNDDRHRLLPEASKRCQRPVSAPGMLCCAAKAFLLLFPVAHGWLGYGQLLAMMIGYLGGLQPPT